MKRLFKLIFFFALIALVTVALNSFVDERAQLSGMDTSKIAPGGLNTRQLRKAQDYFSRYSGLGF